ncbi:hypothetical protein SmJEL517_g01084 [Synchytrium microbalum]|uniref:FAD/NAD(P)-binding domain-containing protein n=1 Tax=Synchytrium microbalum TaxID=1806994 RepID=A0A507CGZ4_9FUNG|nr:uncharacterized protein SmJEL517_g01084 [Synchytrium microbalum]TPX36915.1 hypothetical protein SmJEL517_g01084 [Synchytrium microbalum]
MVYQKIEGDALWEFDFDPKELKAKYLAERDKRLRKDGIEQYVYITPDSKFRSLLEDPYVTLKERAELHDEVPIIILGGGFTGLTTAVKLQNAGITNFRIIEKGGDFGGTWYWNRYPGAACDSESYCYMPLLEETNYIPVSKYTRAPEILAHCERIGKKYDLYKSTIFHTETIESRWDDASSRWIVKTNRGDVMRCQYLISASGPLHKPKLPGVPGLDSFGGHIFHTSRWDYEYTGGNSYGNLTKLGDKRVAIIGTGATAIQAVPYLGEFSKQLYVFQRTPSSVDYRHNKPTDPEWVKSLKPGWKKERENNFNIMTSGGVVDVDLVNDGWTDMFQELMSLISNSSHPKAKNYTIEDMAQLADFRKMERIRARVDQIVKDPKTAEALKPYYNNLCKRPTFSDEYLPTFNRPNVKLVDTNGKGIDALTPKGIMYNGTLYEVDCIIFATGFEVGTSWNSRNGYDIIGRNGLDLEDKWKNGLSTLYGAFMNQFPNLFMVQPGQAAVAVNWPFPQGIQTSAIVKVIKKANDMGATVVEATQEAEDEWVEQIVKASLLNARYLEECTPGYYNREGEVSVLAARNTSFGGGPVAFDEIVTKWRDGDMKGLTFTKGKETAASASARL